MWVSITPFGSHGPKAGYAATDLIVQAASGSVDLAGPIDRPPLRTAAITAFAHAGAEAAGGTLIALAEAQRSGKGQRVEVSAQRAKNLSAFFTLQSDRIGHKRLERSGSGFVICGVVFPFVWPVADGFVSLTVAFDPGNKPFLQRLLAYMKEEDAIDPDLAEMDWQVHLRAVRGGSLPNTDIQRLADSIGPFLADRTKGDLLAAALDRRLLLVPVSTLDDMLDSPQLAERGYWREERTADGRQVRLPAHLVRGVPTEQRGDGLRPASASTPSRCWPKPTPRWRPRPALRRRPPRTAPVRWPGLKVLDMMWVMAGPTSTGVLAQYGATVVRVENAARIDGVRLLPPYYGGKAGRETSLPFGSINAGKLSVTLDPNIPAAREVILDLVRWADIVTESFSPKAMKSWGLDYQSLRQGQAGPDHAELLPVRPGGPLLADGRLRDDGRGHRRHGAAHRLARPAPGGTLRRLHRRLLAPHQHRGRCSPRSSTGAAPARASTSTSPRSRRRCTT